MSDTRKQPTPGSKKIVQIAAAPFGESGDSADVLYALCEDGALWRLTWHEGKRWQRVDTSAVESA